MREEILDVIELPLKHPEVRRVVVVWGCGGVSRSLGRVFSAGRHFFISSIHPIDFLPYRRLPPG